MLSSILNIELAGVGIDVSVINPGPAATELWEQWKDNPMVGIPKFLMSTGKDIAKRMFNGLGRFASFDSGLWVSALRILIGGIGPSVGDFIMKKRVQMLLRD